MKQIIKNIVTIAAGVLLGGIILACAFLIVQNSIKISQLRASLATTQVKQEEIIKFLNGVTAKK